ncbi:hypothetical protein EKO04_004985 [Ascochyta lentis]|uniref:Uncharacterized protein n=1 Tax=Ascochyta lentis TaxID=205686 RepID=A0A8H7J5Z7_9PLEO|nr:hypothetical protein EKO04_004985 [Ascochyta lentis]
MAVSFLENIHSLPADGPSNHAHVIDISTYDPQDFSSTPLSWNLKLWDAVATTLYNISPATLNDFLDTKRHEYKLVLTSKSNEGRIVVWRKDTEVLVGGFVDELDDGVYQWDHVVRCDINNDGGWTINYASYGLYTQRDWQTVWAGSFMDLRSGRGDVSDNATCRSEKAFLLAEKIMEDRPWPARLFSWTISEN